MFMALKVVFPNIDCLLEMSLSHSHEVDVNLFQWHIWEIFVVRQFELGPDLQRCEMMWLQIWKKFQQFSFLLGGNKRLWFDVGMVEVGKKDRFERDDEDDERDYPQHDALGVLNETLLFKRLKNFMHLNSANIFCDKSDDFMESDGHVGHQFFLAILGLKHFAYHSTGDKGNGCAKLEGLAIDRFLLR